MKTSIIISGQISGNYVLRNSLVGNSIEESRKMFNGFKLIFTSKAEAIKAIRNAYNNLVADEPDCKNTFGGIRSNKSRTELYYDSSKAVIITDYEN